MNTKVYKIPAVNFLRLEGEIAKLNRKAKKLGVEPIVLTIIETVNKKFKDPESNIYYDYVVNHCTFTGQTPKLNGWTLVAVIEPVGDNDELLIREVPNQHCPLHYRTTNFLCEHCMTDRRRSSVFILQNEDKEYKKVGRNCLGDFLGSTKPETILHQAEFLYNCDSLFSTSESYEWGSKSGIFTIPIHNFVTMVACVIRRLGYVPRSQACQDNVQPTANIAFNIIFDARNMRSFVDLHKIYPTEVDSELASEAISWASTIATNDTNTYMHDLGVCCRSSYVTAKTIGYVSSVIGAYHRHKASELSKNQETQTSNFIGEIGKRQIFENILIDKMFTNNSGEFIKTFVRFRDKDGNVLVWWASGCPEWLTVGKTVTVKATVKKHSSFLDVSQTELQRVALVSCLETCTTD